MIYWYVLKVGEKGHVPFQRVHSGGRYVIVIDFVKLLISGIMLQLPITAIASACIYFLRFYFEVSGFYYSSKNEILSLVWFVSVD